MFGSHKKIAGTVLSVLILVTIFSVSGMAQGFGYDRETGHSEFTADEVRSFANSQQAIISIRQEFQSRFSEVTDHAQQQSIVHEMNEKLIAAVQGEGLSIERYNEILNAAQEDPQLAQLISQEMQRI